MWNLIKTLRAENGNGVIIWGSSSQFKTAAQCRAFKAFYETDLMKVIRDTARLWGESGIYAHFFLKNTKKKIKLTRFIIYEIQTSTERTCVNSNHIKSTRLWAMKSWMHWKSSAACRCSRAREHNIHFDVIFFAQESHFSFLFRFDCTFMKTFARRGVTQHRATSFHIFFLLLSSLSNARFLLVEFYDEILRRVGKKEAEAARCQMCSRQWELWARLRNASQTMTRSFMCVFWA